MKNLMFFLSILSILTILSSCATRELSAPKSSYSDYPISAIDIRNVEITDSFWLPKIKLIQDSTISYALDKCIEEGRLDNFLIAGGKMQGQVKGKMPFDDTDVYKIIEGASYSLISKPNNKLDNLLDSIISIIAIGQEPDGYITTWFTIDRTSPPADWVKPSKERWENEISSHELYNSGHLFEAAAAHYRATGKRNFLDIAVKNADLLVAHFGPDKLGLPPGHQIAETGLIKLFQITGNEKYLQLSKFLLDSRGDSTTHKLYGAYNQDHLPVTAQHEAVGHAVRAEYMYAGMTDIAAIYGDSKYLDAVFKLWDNVVNKKMYITGGLGARREGEAFGDNYELPNLSAYSETCAAIGSVHWNQRLFQLTGDSKYYDVLERTLYNGLISGISLDGKKFFYPNPLESDGLNKFNMGACTRQSWFDCSCCPTNLIRFIPSLPGLIYATQADTLFVNLFMSNNAEVKVGSNDVAIRQTTSYPLSNGIGIEVNPKNKAFFTVKVRLPGWAQNIVAPGTLYHYVDKTNDPIIVKINDIEVPVKLNRGYAEITREWSAGDKIALTLPMTVRKVITNKIVKSNLGKIAFEYGPIVYCAEQIDNPALDALSIGEVDIKASVVPNVLLGEKVNVINGHVKGKKFALIPYYLWSNRGVGKMKVWL